MKDQKITSDHLRKTAYLYVRQSSMKQVIENTDLPFKDPLKTNIKQTNLCSP
jgi:hypothetical protein